MNEKHDPLNDLKEIRQMMESSSRFISLSGLSGVLVGIYALIGVGLVYYYQLYHFPWDQFATRRSGSIFGLYKFLNYIGAYVTYNLDYQVFIIAALVLILAIATSFYFTYRKIKNDGASMWTPVTRKLLINLFVPLIAGGWVALILAYHRLDVMITATCLIFYGMALMNASKYTLPDIWYLGLIQIGLGMVNFIIPGYGLILWGIGFGVAHIIYGLIMYNKYERK